MDGWRQLAEGMPPDKDSLPGSPPQRTLVLYRVAVTEQAPQDLGDLEGVTDMVETRFMLRGTPAAVVTLLSAARAQGVTVTRTKIAKLLYLADLRAVEVLGRPGSEVRWRWLHYGPFSNTLLTIEDDLVADGVVERETTKNYFGSAEHRLWLKQLISVDVDAKFATVIEEVTREYGKLAPSTLRDLTYQTAPMLEAQRDDARGEFLDLLSGQPVPDVTSTLRRFQRVVNRLEPQTDEGDIEAGLSNEIADWASHRIRATSKIVGD